MTQPIEKLDEQGSLANAAVREELLEASDAAIEEAVEFADAMALRGLVYQLTGDPEIAATKVVIGTSRGFTGGIEPTPEATALIRRKAAEFLKSYRDAGAGELGIGPMDRLPKSMALTIGKDIEPESYDLWLEELALNPWARGLEWSQEPPERVRDFSVTIIGAGMGGLNAAIQLKRAGIPYSVIEKNEGVGGTWHENRYPGARVDTPSRLYTHVFASDYSYPYSFCPWTENQKYFDWVADTFDVRRDITFKTEVRSLVWDEADSMWDITVDGPEGVRTLRSNAVITAVGFLNRPAPPDIPGVDRFEGPSWHTARWPADFDPKGKRVAVIGTGCTGYQMVPELALEAQHVTVFQRTPQWLFPSPGYRSPFPPQVPWLDRNLPFHTNFMRLRVAGGFSAGFGPIAQIDPDFHDEHAVSEINKAARDNCMAFLREKLGDDEDLIETMTPEHPVLSARPVIVDSEYSILDAIQRDDVTLVVDGIRRVTEAGVETEAGEVYEVDAIVYATGFKATEYLFPMSITGRDGMTVEKLWSETGAQGYVGAMIPGCPNLWTLYGPNSNGGLLVPAFQEMETYYALKCIERLVLDDKKSIDVKEDAYRQYNEMIDERNQNMAWSDPRAQNYYWTKFGRSATQNPLTPLEMWTFLREPNFGHLDVR
ncbi:MAG: NAD(P)/FAD-dependent oxidoreductase [Deltaproteobacteria bacterium]|jgi:4-hydroxyacetophenone monooxygenase|nr:NAD(P)/FAD-dependent oxidoreductase [Deltaproteobacteria bacterium]